MVKVSLISKERKFLTMIIFIQQFLVMNFSYQSLDYCFLSLQKRNKLTLENRSKYKNYKFIYYLFMFIPRLEITIS